MRLRRPEMTMYERNATPAELKRLYETQLKVIELANADYCEKIKVYGSTIRTNEIRAEQLRQRLSTLGGQS